ncbi:MAG: indolepyruvate ferredoxin oxidoreductase subunit alpha [Peptococcaceae bacterium]|nr:indolepyruvate ferredoxin oxidoreductase subunit alpha [Peptococcaceae bacterium]
MSIYAVALDQPGCSVVLTGNEAVARGAIEAGVAFAACYPGSPTAEVLPTLAQLGDKFNIYTEFSTNEKVAIEEAAAASFAGLRSITICKADGFNVALDFATAVCLSGTRGGMVIMVGDDPAAHSSVKEEDSRFLARTASLPVLEPASVAEAKEITRAAFELSEKIMLPVVVRCTTRICHASGDVKLGPLPAAEKKAVLTRDQRFVTSALFAQFMKNKVKSAAALAENSPFNSYTGPENAERIVIACGPSHAYALEAVDMLGLAESVGVLKVSTTWPLPENFVLKYLKPAKEVVFAEEVDSFLEDGVMTLAAKHWEEVGRVKFYGKNSGHVAGPRGAFAGELDPDVLASCLGRIFNVPYEPPSLPNTREARDLVNNNLPGRELALCAGCPHRASFWAIKTAVELDGRDAIVLGDIGCYTLGLMRTGYNILQSVHCMGAGIGLASGLGKLDRFDFRQPVITVVGDSTFFHAAPQALINARYNQSGLLCIILDNETTAMTGHQPHPGRGVDAAGRPAGRVEIEPMLAGMGIPVTVHDPYDVEGTAGVICRLLRETGPRALVLRRACALVAVKGKKKDRVYVDPEKCIGDDCGCARFCSRVFACPANIWDAGTGRARIDEAVCNGCGVCASLCPRRAIIVERTV